MLRHRPDESPIPVQSRIAGGRGDRYEMVDFRIIVFAAARIVVLSGDRRRGQRRCHWQVADRRFSAARRAVRGRENSESTI